MFSHDESHPLVLEAVGTPEELRRELQGSLESIRHLNRGSLVLSFRTKVDGPLLRIAGEGERTEYWLGIENGHLVQRVRTEDGLRVLDAEDADHLDDGVLHHVAVTVDDDGTRLYLDGYQVFSGTAAQFFSAVTDPVDVNVGDEGVPEVRTLQIRCDVLAPRKILSLAPAATPLVEFAASHLAQRDTARCATLRTGSLRARFRVRGRHQGGVIMQGAGDLGAATLSISGGNLRYTVQAGGATLMDLSAEGQWDDGGWHDIVVTTGFGATTLYANGFQVGRVAGVAFLADVPGLTEMWVGRDRHGSRLFGEAQTAMVYDHPLSDVQVKRLASVPPLVTTALFDTGFHGSASYRIPSLLTTSTGVLIAGADQRTAIANDSPNHINFVIRRSMDGGQTWNEIQTVIPSVGEGETGASVIDSVLVEDTQRGRIICLIDHFPGGVGQPNCKPGTGYDEQGRMVLEAADGQHVLLAADGSVIDEEGEDTPWHVSADGSVTREGRPTGNIASARDAGDAETLLKERTSYLWMITSDDDGESWSEPVDLNPQLKQPWMRFLGTSPGSGVQIRGGAHAGRLVMPVYYNHEQGITFSAAVVFSDDGGETWTLGASPNDGRMVNGAVVNSRDLSDDEGSLHESTVVEIAGGELLLLLRNQHRSGRVARCVSSDGGATWGEVTYDPQLTEIFSQPNAIRVDVNGRGGIVFANASQLLPFRGCGALRLSFDDGVTWPHNRVFNPRHYVYQCMAQLPNGDLGLLWEREWHGLYFTRLPLTWLTESRSTIS